MDLGLIVLDPSRRTARAGVDVPPGASHTRCGNEEYRNVTYHQGEFHRMRWFPRRACGLHQHPAATGPPLGTGEGALRTHPSSFRSSTGTAPMRGPQAGQDRLGGHLKERSPPVVGSAGSRDSTGPVGLGPLDCLHSLPDLLADRSLSLRPQHGFQNGKGRLALHHTEGMGSRGPDTPGPVLSQTLE